MTNIAAAGKTRSESPDADSTPDTPSSGLSTRQLQILGFLRGAIAEQGFPPTLREIAQAVGLRSPSSVVHQLDQLEAKGLVVRADGRFRGQRIPADTAQSQERTTAGIVGCPLLGHSSEEHDDGTASVIVLKVPLDRHISHALRSGAHLTVRQLPAASDTASVAGSVTGQVVGVLHPVYGSRPVPTERTGTG